MFNLAIFASGSGSNAEKIMRYFDGHADISVDLVVSNNSDAKVLERADALNVMTKVHSIKDMEDGTLASFLIDGEYDLIVLAGYIKKIHASILEAFPNKIVNIHPALLPKFGGKGMYGRNVHAAVIAADETESGMTIHFVNQNYDEGAIIEQHKCEVLKSDTPDELAARVLKLEHQHFAPCIERLLLKR